jgi:hypothetical protein
MIITLIARYKLALEIAVFGTFVAALLYGCHCLLEHERDIGRNEIRAQWDKQIAADKEAARIRSDELKAQRDTAQIEGAKRDETIRTLAVSSAAATGGLRDAITKINGAVPNYSADALRALASAYGDVLAECQGRRAAVAEEAERLNSEKRTLIEAWPKGTNEDTVHP